MTFRLYDTGAGCPGGGTLLLTDAHASVPVSGGLFNVALGSGTAPPGALSAAFRDNAEVWVEIEVGGEVLCPRVRVESSAYALMAGGLNTLDNVGIGTTSPSGSLHMFYGNGILMQGDDVSNLTLRFQDDDTGSIYEIAGNPGIGAIDFRTNGTSRAVITAPGNVGIGTTSPTETLEVIGNGKFTGTLEATGNLQVGGDLLFANGTVQTTAVNFLPPDTCFDNVGRFVVCGNGAVKDNLTGLFWLENANCFGLLNWAAANSAASQLADGQCGLTDGSSPGDWRLPTDAEWQVIVDQAVANGCSAPYFPDVEGLGCCGPDVCAFAGVQSDSTWSSTTFASNPRFGRFGNLIAGSVGNGLKTNFGYVWPVRVGP